MLAEASQPYYQVDSRVSPSLSQAAGRGQTTLDGFGLSISGSSENVSLNGLLLRMLQHYFTPKNGLTYTATFKKKATRYHHSYYELQTQARHILERERLWLPTPTASQDTKRIRPLIPSEIKQREGKKGHGTMLCGALGERYPSLIGHFIHPEYTEWLMGFPANWTNPDCKLSATQLCQDAYSRSLMPSEELREVSAE